ncbi:thiosulfate sulfurtransferase/rhodanese-like domain-containing protein 3 isoform X2 [Diachasmimorpha longicaudata]|uniref:thiosulfate sulfurtransferase/rhodanese-like domain-containing protein 3 isoform X2 n=1 Tax=Diachasmimorpha longicaudata TaxID=58733 RepID=UPI0030B8B697
MGGQLHRVLRPFRWLKLSSWSSIHQQNPGFLTPKSQQSPLTTSSPINSRMSTRESQGSPPKPQKVDYDGLLEAQRDKSVLIIDVREQMEIDETGKLPGSIHIPMGDVSKVLEVLPDDEFQKKYEKPKPGKETKIILSCRAGMRSAKVQDELEKLGYQNAWNYPGGWGEWESKQKS